jgi:hypothetical protein
MKLENVHAGKSKGSRQSVRKWKTSHLQQLHHLLQQLITQRQYIYREKIVAKLGIWCDMVSILL